MALSATRCGELEDKTEADLEGLSSREKFHKQYRRNGIPIARIRANALAIMDQFSSWNSMLDDEVKGLRSTG